MQPVVVYAGLPTLFETDNEQSDTTIKKDPCRGALASVMNVEGGLVRAEGEGARTRFRDYVDGIPTIQVRTSPWKGTATRI